MNQDEDILDQYCRNFYSILRYDESHCTDPRSLLNYIPWMPVVDYIQQNIINLPWDDV